MAGALTAAIAAAFSGSDSSDPYFEYTTLLLPGNGTNGAQNNTFLDGSTNNFTITRNGNTTQGTFSPFSQTGWGNYFASSTSNLKFASNAVFAIGTGNFTVECFVNFNAWTGTNQTIFLQDISGTGNLQITRNSGANNLIVTIANSAVISYSWTPTLGQWYYIAIVRSGTGSNQVALYIDGTSVATGTSSGSIPQQQAIIGGLDWASGYAIQGYISNFRYSNIARTISVPTTSYTSDANTLILTCQSNRFVDNSASPKTITVNGTTSVVAFSPFNPTASWSAATNGGSGYFDGNGDYLSVSNASLAFGNSNFTLECWVYATSSPTDVGIFEGRNLGSGTSGFTITAFNSTTIRIFSGSVLITSGSINYLNTWCHVAVERASGTTTLYINGQSQGTTTSLGNLTDSSFIIGAGRYTGVSTPSAFFPGYISNFRIVNGAAVYNGNFTPPTAPLTAITNTSLLLNFTNAGIYDATSKNDLETVGNAQISTAISAKWGSGSMYFDGSGDRLYQPSNQNYNFGTGDFTIEFWAYPTSQGGHGSSNNDCLIDFRPGANGVYGTLYIFNSGAGVYYYVNSANRITGAAISNNTWTHIALCRASGNTRLFLNGTQSGSTYTDANNYLVAPITIGEFSDGAGGGNFAGYMQDFRITKGYARYTANFTAPTAAFPTL